MYLHPSIEDCRYVILQQLFAWQAVVTSQERIQSTRYQVPLFSQIVLSGWQGGLQTSVYQVGLDRPVTQTYRDILTRLPGGNKILESAYETVEITISDVKNYVDEWLRYQVMIQC